LLQSSGNLTVEGIFSQELLLEISVKLISVGIILFVTFIIAWLVGTIIDRLFTFALPRYKRPLRRYIQWLVWALGAIFALSVLGLDVNLFLIIITLIGIALLLSLQDLLRNLAAKAALDVNPPYKIGDTVEVLGHTGRVVQMNFLTTVLLDEHGQLVHIPNAEFLRNATVNFSSEAGTRVDVMISLPIDADLDDLEKKVGELSEHMGEHLIEDYPPRMEVRRITPDHVVVAVLLRVISPEKCSSVASEANRYLLENL